MAAYCHLLEVCEGARSPYGVILKGETFAAVTVPNTQRTRAMFHEALLAAREVVRESEEVNRSPLPPEPSSATIVRVAGPFGCDRTSGTCGTVDHSSRRWQGITKEESTTVIVATAFGGFHRIDKRSS